MRRRILLFVMIIAAGALSMGGVGIVGAQDGTIPTRTPTPGAGQPTQVIPTATNDNPGNPPPPAATQTSAAPAATPTGTLPPAGGTAAAQTPAATLVGAGAAIPAAADCDDTPIIEADRRMAVYAGPGGDYEIVAALETGETRIILGRAGFADWWQIQLSPGIVAWVDDEDVTVRGNVGIVPVVDPPAINGVAPTRGPVWNPTPPPFTPCGPTVTPSATPTATMTGTVIAPAGAEDREGGSDSSTGSAGTAVPPAATSVTDGVTPITETGESATGSGVTSRGSEDSRAASPTSAVNLVLPITGLVLIGGGIILALMARSRGPKPDAPKE